MSLLRNRIVISLLIIIALATWWEFGGKPVSGPIYVEAVDAYKEGDYQRSLDILDRAYQVDPNDATTLTLYGWNYLKLSRFTEAEPYFDRALKLEPDLIDARRGRAHCWLELGQADRALEDFRSLPPVIQGTPEVQLAMARALRIKGQNDEAAKLLVVVLQREPDNQLARTEFEQLAGVTSPEVLASLQVVKPRPETLQVAARLEGGYFQVPQGNGWKQIYVAGANLGPARPGHFVSEPPMQVEVYASWIERMDSQGANAIRVYTLLPPAFYRALLDHNTKNPDRPLYLFQEIWLPEPPEGNLYDREFTAGFESEIRNLVDVVHGQASLPAERGRAGGIYSADVSPYVLGWLVGREMEPSLVLTTNLRNPNQRSFQGRFLGISNGNASEVWLTRMCDTVVAYEQEKYNWMRPVSWVSWPPLDPLYHPSETGLQEEWQLRRAQGELLPPLRVGLVDDNDAVALDEERVNPTPELKSGYFATSHVYPFYPDFIIHDAKYRAARDKLGVNSYWGYLQDLKSHYRKTPLLVAEYGLSTSIGIAHFNPYGWNHGGLEEAQQGEAMVRLTQNIRDAGFAGGIVFEWIDEWWKHNWIAYHFEQPFARKALWQNDLDPEQHFGLMKFVPANPPEEKEAWAGAAGTAPAGVPRIERVSWSSDPSALYLTLQLDSTAGEQLNWDQANYAVALNTCGRACGSRAVPVPGLGEAHYDDGFNFLLRLAGPNTRLLVADTYNPYRELRVPGVPRLTDRAILRGQRVEVRDSMEFGELIVETNRRRYGRDGTFYPAERYSRSVLVPGVFDRDRATYSSVGQWYYDGARREIRVRLSWGLLLVMDPSGGGVYWGTDENAKPVSTQSNGISLAAFAYSPGGSGGTQAAPGASGSTLQTVTAEWPKWERVEYRQVPKKSFEILRREFEQITGRRGRGR